VKGLKELPLKKENENGKAMFQLSTNAIQSKEKKEKILNINFFRFIINEYLNAKIVMGPRF
jgi:hypothetical protein